MQYYKQSSSLTIDTMLIAILERGVASGVFRALDPFQTAINIMGSCLFYYIGQGNIKHHANENLLSKAMLEQHTQEVILFTLAGVRIGK